MRNVNDHCLSYDYKHSWICFSIVLTKKRVEKISTPACFEKTLTGLTQNEKQSLSHCCPHLFLSLLISKVMKKIRRNDQEFKILKSKNGVQIYGDMYVPGHILMRKTLTILGCEMRKELIILHI